MPLFPVFSLLLLLLLPIRAIGPGGSERPASRIAVPGAGIYRFPLRGTMRARGMSAAAVLHPPPSPFGMAVTADGHPVYDLDVTFKGLRPPRALGGEVYVVWMTTPALDRIERLGTVEDPGHFRARISSMNKFILLVTVEPFADGDKRTGPIILRGVSPSGFLTAFGGHELFNNMPHD